VEAVKESDLQNLCCDSQSNNRLKRYRSSLMKDSRDVVFDDRILNVMLRYAKDPDQVQSVRAYLNNLRDGEGSFCRSFKSYDGMVGTLSEFQKDDVPDGRWRKEYQLGKSRVLARYSSAKLKAMDFQTDDEIYDLVKDLHTSTGWTSIIDGVTHKCDLPKDQLLLDWREKSGSALKEGSFNSPMVWFWRSQASGEISETGEFTGKFKRKTRPVWAVDVWTVISEMMFSRPLNNWLKFYQYTAIGKDDDAIWKWSSLNRRRHDNWVSLDYSKYDSSIPAWLIHDAFQVLRSAFSFLTGDQSKLLEVIETDFIHKNVILGDDVVHVDKGNPSGSGLTAIINGICNELITEQWLGKYSVDAKYMIMGDDNLIYYYGDKLDIATIASYIEYNFGVHVNADKTKSGTHFEAPEFLSRFWDHDGPYRHPNVLISKMLFPERWRPYDKVEELTPELVFYSYVLGYRAGMSRAFDIERFLRDTGLHDRIIGEGSAAYKSLPYHVQVAWAMKAS